MTIDEAIADLTQRVLDVAPDAVVRIARRSDTEAAMRVYALADLGPAIRAATSDITLLLLTGDGIDVQVLVYDVATSVPPETEL